MDEDRVPFSVFRFPLKGYGKSENRFGRSGDSISKYNRFSGKWRVVIKKFLPGNELACIGVNLRLKNSRRCPPINLEL
jgi:hypothetical protein